MAGLLDYVAAPMPLLVGIHKSLEERARKIWGEELVLVDLDSDEMQVQIGIGCRSLSTSVCLIVVKPFRR